MSEAGSGGPSKPPRPREVPWLSHPGCTGGLRKDAPSVSTVPRASLWVAPQDSPTAEQSACMTSPTCGAGQSAQGEKMRHGDVGRWGGWGRARLRHEVVGWQDDQGPQEADSSPEERGDDGQRVRQRLPAARGRADAEVVHQVLLRLWSAQGRHQLL